MNGFEQARDVQKAVNIINAWIRQMNKSGGGGVYLSLKNNKDFSVKLTDEITISSYEMCGGKCYEYYK